MNHTRSSKSRSCGPLNLCHSERSVAVSEANLPTESKNPMFPESATGADRNFRIAVRFFDEHHSEVRQRNS